MLCDRPQRNGTALRVKRLQQTNMTLEMFLTVALNGLTIASLYFIVAVGFSLIFGLMRTVNMAHGSLC